MFHSKTLQRPPVRRARAPARETGLDWEASGWAGLAGGAAFVLIQTFAGAVFGGGGRTEAVRRLASLALGGSVMTADVPFTALVYLAAAAVHIPLSLIYARVLAAMIDGLDMARSLAAGAAFGAGLYFVNYHVFSSVFPWFVAARGEAAVIAHLAFGLIAAGVYAGLTRRRNVLRKWIRPVGRI
jgi:hypothetical protein